MMWKSLPIAIEDQSLRSRDGHSLPCTDLTGGGRVTAGHTTQPKLQFIISKSLEQFISFRAPPSPADGGWSSRADPRIQLVTCLVRARLLVYTWTTTE